MIAKLILFICSISILSAQSAGNFDHSIFDSILKKNVSTEGFVNYKGVDQTKLDEYVQKVADADLSSLNNNEQLAFFINAYNALVIKNVLNYYPVEGPMKVDKFFDKNKFKIAGESLSLNELEYQKIFPIEPVMVHFGLVCAAVSCPKLLQTVYTGENVYNQLNENAVDFINNSKKNYLDKENSTLYLSEIFKWFRDSFEKRFGSLDKAARKFMNEDDRNFLNANKVEVDFLKYNWNLNEQK